VDLVRRQRVAAYGVARHGGSVLLVRTSHAGDGRRTWWLPGGGVDFAESPEDCLAREFVEEAGLQVVTAHLRDALSDVHPVPTESTLFHSIRLIYDVTVGPGPAGVERDGSTDVVGWFDESEWGGLPLAPWLGGYLAGRFLR
jgi:8-oxo-dGTP diphosphatase